MPTHLTYLGAGPAKLPESVLEEAARAVRNYNGSGLSVLELPHRGKAFDAILEEADALVRELCGIDKQYEVLWLQGGGRLQFAMIPANFLGEEQTAGYIDSGHWAHDALETARVYGKVSVLASSKAAGYASLPAWPQEPDPSLAYLHLTTNNTIYGTQWQDVPETGVPLVADMSSDIFGVPRDYSRYALFYAVAQKNLGPAGVTLVVGRKDFLEQQQRELPAYLSYRAHLAAGGVLNTVPVFAIYVSMLCLRWLKEKGLDHQIKENLEKAGLLYTTLEKSHLFYCPVSPESRSRMNVIFRGKTPEIEASFSAYCAAQNIAGIAGHRSAGGFRASLYNAVRMDDVRALVGVIESFERQHD